MPRFLLSNPAGGVKELILQPGMNRIGRTAENDHAIEDPSISRSHCEVTVAGDRVLIKDLGSSNGTYLDGQPVQTAEVLPGQTVRLGSVEMVLQHETAGEVAAPVVATPPVPTRLRVQVAAPAAIAVAAPVGEAEDIPPGPDDCLRHAGVAAAYICQNCLEQFCTGCVKTLRAGMRTFYSCPSCSATCVPMAQYRKALVEESVTFRELAFGAFRYPLREHGLMMMVTGSLFFSVLAWASFFAKYAGLMGFLAVLILLITSLGYMFSFMRSIATTSAQGATEMPGWPDFSNFWDDLVVPCFHFICILVLYLGPGLAAVLWVSPILGVAMILGGLLCLPMALLTVSMADTLGGLNPIVVFSSIGKVPGAYLLACGIFLLLLALRTGVEYLGELTRIPVAPGLVVQFVGLYGLTVQMRIMGLFYRKYRERLAWFG